MAAKYRVEITPAAQRELSKLPKKVQKRIDERSLIVVAVGYISLRYRKSPDVFTDGGRPMVEDTSGKA